MKIRILVAAMNVLIIAVPCVSLQCMDNSPDSTSSAPEPTTRSMGRHKIPAIVTKRANSNTANEHMVSEIVSPRHRRVQTSIQSPRSPLTARGRRAAEVATMRERLNGIQDIMNELEASRKIVENEFLAKSDKKDRIKKIIEYYELVRDIKDGSAEKRCGFSNEPRVSRLMLLDPVICQAVGEAFSPEQRCQALFKELTDAKVSIDHKASNIDALLRYWINEKMKVTREGDDLEHKLLRIEDTLESATKKYKECKNRLAALLSD